MSRRVKYLALSGLLGLFVLSCLVVETADAQQGGQTKCCQSQSTRKGREDRRQTYDYCRTKILATIYDSSTPPNCLYKVFEIQECQAQTYGTLEGDCNADAHPDGCATSEPQRYCDVFRFTKGPRFPVYVQTDRPFLWMKLATQKGFYADKNVGDLSIEPADGVSAKRFRVEFTVKGEDRARLADVLVFDIGRENDKYRGAIAIEIPNDGKGTIAAQNVWKVIGINGVKIKFMAEDVAGARMITCFVHLLKHPVANR